MSSTELLTSPPSSRNLHELKAREQTLRHAFIYEQRIERAVFEEESVQLQNRRSTLEGERRRQRLDEVNTDDVIARCELLIASLGESWNTAEIQARRALQRLVYPDGVPVLAGTLGTPRKARVFSVLRAIEGGRVTSGGADGI